MLVTRDSTARVLTLRAATVNEQERTVEAVIATEAKTAVYDAYNHRGIVDEILLAAGAELPAQLVLLDGHARELDAVLGSVRSLRVDGGNIIGRLHFASTPDVDGVWRKVADGHLTDVSVGYQIDAAEEIPAGQSRVVNGRTFTAGPRALRVVNRWAPKEASIVSIGADPNSHTRSLTPPTKETAMSSARVLSAPADTLYRAVAPIVQRGGPAITWAAFSEVALRHLGAEVPRNDADTIRAAISSAAIADAIDALFGSAIVRGFDAEPDTTTGWTRETPLPNFLTAELFGLDKQTRLDRLTRGQEAEHAEYGLSKERWRLARYGKQFVVDEQDAIDGQPLGAVLLAAEQLGSAARRLRPDLVYSLILENPTLAADSIALFEASTHKNLGSGGGSAMGATGLSAGIAAIGNQVYTDKDGAPIHVNNRAAVLAVPPDLVEVSRRTVCATILADGNDLAVVQESRLGATGVLDPASDTLYTGSSTCWLLAARASSAPSIVVGGLNGRLTPSVRRFNLSNGAWGFGWDIVLDIAAAALDFRGLYFSLGA